MAITNAPYQTPVAQPQQVVTFAPRMGQTRELDAFSSFLGAVSPMMQTINQISTRVKQRRRKAELQEQRDFARGQLGIKTGYVHLDQPLHKRIVDPAILPEDERARPGSVAERQILDALQAGNTALAAGGIAETIVMNTEDRLANLDNEDVDWGNLGAVKAFEIDLYPSEAAYNMLSFDDQSALQKRLEGKIGLAITKKLAAEQLKNQQQIVSGLKTADKALNKSYFAKQPAGYSNHAELVAAQDPKVQAEYYGSFLQRTINAALIEEGAEDGNIDAIDMLQAEATRHGTLRGVPLELIAPDNDVTKVFAKLEAASNSVVERIGNIENNRGQQYGRKIYDEFVNDPLYKSGSFRNDYQRDNWLKEKIESLNLPEKSATKAKEYVNNRIQASKYDDDKGDWAVEEITIMQNPETVEAMRETTYAKERAGWISPEEAKRRIASLDAIERQAGSLTDVQKANIEFARLLGDRLETALTNRTTDVFGGTGLLTTSENGVNFWGQQFINNAIGLEELARVGNRKGMSEFFFRQARLYTTATAEEVKAALESVGLPIPEKLNQEIQEQEQEATAAGGGTVTTPPAGTTTTTVGSGTKKKDETPAAPWLNGTGTPEDDKDDDEEQAGTGTTTTITGGGGATITDQQLREFRGSTNPRQTLYDHIDGLGLSAQEAADLYLEWLDRMNALEVVR